MAHTLLSDFASQAKAILRRSRIFDLRCLEVDQEADCVVLRGSVDSFYHKQLAQELLKTAIDGVEVINEIHVDYSRQRAEDDCDWLW
jgi:BON domain-containing protein